MSAVADGYFTVSLDFGTGVFKGDARWIQVEVRPGASTGSYTALSPRTELAGVPYALSLRPGTVVNTSQVDVPAITVGTPNANSNALVATGTGDGYAVVFAEDQSTAGGIGLFGNSVAGKGVYGASNADEVDYLDNLNPGVYGISDGNSGVGVIGEATDDYGLGVRAKGGYVDYIRLETSFP